MKSAVAVLGLAAIANAFEFPKHAQYHHKRSNYTEPAGTSAAAGSGSDYTTVTVLTTQVRTITSCAPTVTNCPARQTAIDQLPANQKHVVYVTDTVVLTETVCPVSEAGKVSSSVIQQAQTGGITPQYTITATAPGATTPAAAAIPLSTGYSAPVTDSDSSGGENTSLTTLVSTTVVDKTLTLTISNQVTTTTVQSTIETTVTVPCSQVTDQAVKSGEDNSGVSPTKGSGNSYGQGSSATEDTTTTVTGTKTITITLTVSDSESTATGVSGGDNSGQNNGYATAQSTPSATGGSSSGESNNGSSNGSSSGNSGSEGSCECNGATATVTVTQPASTVYVTVGTEAASTTAPYSSESTGTNNSGSDDSGDDDDEDDDSCEDDITTTLQATVTVVPYPINGTTAAPTGYAKPSGFARLVR